MNKGQEFTTFKLVLGAVFATALLVIVYSVSQGIGAPYSSFEEVKDLLLNAYKAKGTNQCFSREKVELRVNDQFSRTDLSSIISNFPVNFQNSLSIMKVINSDLMEARTSSQAKISSKCGTTYCVIYFGSSTCT